MNMHYKILSVTASGRLASMCYKRPGAIQYQQNQWVSARSSYAAQGYHLTVFRDRKSVV